jgi:phosphoribosyl 1,2-cyclic phosphate phosphodiesterase
MAGISITFLGTGTSQGIPVIGCDCAVCRSADPRDQRTRTSIYVETPECAWIVDTGADFRAQCLREQIRRVDAVVYTHAHTDHIMGFDDLRPFARHEKPLPIYASAATLADLERVFRFAFDGEHRFPGYLHPAPRTVTGTFQLGATDLEPLELPHGRATVHGYLFSRDGERLAAYLTDCHAVSDEIVERIAGVRHLIVDALRRRPHPTHMTIAQAVAVAERARAERAWLTHLCHDLTHAEIEASLPPAVRVAYDGLKIEA